MLNIPIGRGSETQRQVLTLLYEHGPMTRNQLASSLELSMPTLSHVTTDLIAAGLVAQTQALQSTGGRRAMTLELVSGCRLVLSVEIDDGELELALTDLSLRTVAIDRSGLSEDQAARHQQAMDAVINFVNREKISADRLLGIAVLHSEEQPSMEAHRLAQTLTEEMEAPATVLSRELAASLANALPLTDGVYLELSRQVRCLAVKNHRPIHSQSEGLAHLATDIRSDLVCSCGRKGCFANLCSTKRLWSDFSGRERFWQQVQAGTAAEPWQTYLQTLSGFLDSIQSLMGLPITIASDFTMELSCDLPKAFAALTGRSMEHISCIRAMNDDPISGSALLLICEALYH